MSPRAAWQLERMGFGDVYDFVPGKIEWIRRRLPLEGKGPHYFVAGEVLNERYPTCTPETPVRAAAASMDSSGEPFCLVVNDEGILLGRVRRKKVQPNDDRTVAEVMEPGPATVRLVEPLKPLVKRMQHAGVGTIVVSDHKGHLLGVVRRHGAEKALGTTGALRITS